MGVLIATFSLPSSTKILANVPSFTASTSIVALSVSISQITSPTATVSPTCFTHRAKVPSVMVGDSAGMVMVVAMVCLPSASGVNGNTPL